MDGCLRRRQGWAGICSTPARSQGRDQGPGLHGPLARAVTQNTTLAISRMTTSTRPRWMRVPSWVQRLDQLGCVCRRGFWKKCDVPADVSLHFVHQDLTMPHHVSRFLLLSPHHPATAPYHGAHWRVLVPLLPRFKGTSHYASGLASVFSALWRSNGAVSFTAHRPDDRTATPLPLSRERLVATALVCAILYTNCSSSRAVKIALLIAPGHSCAATASTCSTPGPDTTLAAMMRPSGRRAIVQRDATCNRCPRACIDL